MNHSPSAFVFAGLALLGCSRFIAKSANSDFQRQLRMLKGLSSLPEERLAERRAECHEHTVKRLQFFRRKTLLSLFWVLSALVAAIAFVLAQQMNPPSFSRQHWFGIASFGSFSWGTLGRLGWHQGSFSGATIYEELDTLMFWLLYWIGTLCGVVALFAHV